MASERARLAGVGMARGPGYRTWGRRAARWLVVHRARILASVAALSIRGRRRVVSRRGARRGAVMCGVRRSRCWPPSWRSRSCRTVSSIITWASTRSRWSRWSGRSALGQELAGRDRRPDVLRRRGARGRRLDRARAASSRRWSSAPRRSPSCGSATGSRRCRSTRSQTGDVVVVRTGEVVPVDGTVVSAEAVVDTSTLSGEPLPVTLARRAWRC